MALRSSSRKVYDDKWNAYLEWCEEHDFSHPAKLPQTTVLEFLEEKSRTVGAFSTILGYITALSRRHEGFSIGTRVKKLSDLSSLQTWKKGAEVRMAKPRSRTPTWCLEVVLKALRSPPYHPLVRGCTDYQKLLTRRTVFLVAVSSARRASEVHALEYPLDFSGSLVRLWTKEDFLHKVENDWTKNLEIALPSMLEDDDVNLRKLCVRRALLEYTNATQQFRDGSKASQLFRCYGSERKGEPVSKKRVSQWLVETITHAYELQKLPLPGLVKGHQVRKQATSWAVEAGLDPQTICDAATWSNTTTFVKAYKLDVVHRGRAVFGHSVLAAASGVAPSSTPPSSQPSRAKGTLRKASGLAPGYKIPRRK